MDRELEKTEELLKKDRKKGKKRTAIIIIAGILVIACIAGIAGVDMHKHKAAAKSLEQAEKYMMESEYEQAVQSYTAAIEIDEKSEKAFEGRADAYMGMSKPKDAAKDYIAAIKLDNENEELCRKGLAAAISSGDEKTVEEMKEAVKDSGVKVNADELLYGSYITDALEAFKNGDYDEAKRLSDKLPKEGSFTEECVNNMSDKQKAAFKAKVQQMDKEEMDPSEYIEGINGYFLTDFDNDGIAELIVNTVNHEYSSQVVFTVFKYDEENDSVEEMTNWGGRNVWALAYPGHEGVVMLATDTSYLAYQVQTMDGATDQGSRQLDVDKIDEQMIEIGINVDMHRDLNTNELDYSVFD